MLQILRDQIWAFIGVIATLVATIISVWGIIAGRKKKSLCYEVLTSSPLLTTSDELRGKIRIQFNKKIIDDVYLLVIKLLNDGNIDILPEDFYEDLVFSFGEATKVLSAEIIESFPETFKPKISVSGSKVSISPTLINRKDSCNIKFLLSKYEYTNRKIQARIAGMGNINEVIQQIAVTPRDVGQVVFDLVNIFLYSFAFLIVVFLLFPSLEKVIATAFASAILIPIACGYLYTKLTIYLRGPSKEVH